jgi:hypothetical protein
VGLYDSKLGPFTEEDFKFHPNGYETPGYAFTLLLDRAELVEHLEPGVARAFLQSGLIEVMELAIALKQDATNLTKANADLAAANESLSAKVDKLTKEKLVADEAVKRLKGDNKEYGKIIKEAKTTMSDALAEVDRLDKALEFERAKAVEKLILDERVRVVGTQARPQLASYMPAEQIQVSRTVTSLKTAMERIRKQQAGLLWFVDLDGLTTKESFDVEQWMQKHKLAYRMVSGSTVELVQRILVDMQGDMQYETN